MSGLTQKFSSDQQRRGSWRAYMVYCPLIGRYAGIILFPVASLPCYQFVIHPGHMSWHPERLIVTSWRKCGCLSTQGHYIEVAEARITAHMGFRHVSAAFAADLPGTRSVQSR
jgi:hypothetical protein